MHACVNGRRALKRRAPSTAHRTRPRLAIENVRPVGERKRGATALGPRPSGSENPSGAVLPARAKRARGNRSFRRCRVRRR
ncbi:hypothetical protein MBEHAL_1646 [Halarchaeum acidiphilum MH1-52-1]|uniref:Uncharacterized protein n=1 Tax=Halarchaeum acidiphilum MH1-52-1 TaxID=1261545 RepID=U2YFN6_9EURY|nr:hypothetical protein MBEHAL_1646 [Halarchaeum acidiphilum MH1-52-1]